MEKEINQEKLLEFIMKALTKIEEENRFEENLHEIKKRVYFLYSKIK